MDALQLLCEVATADLYPGDSSSDESDLLVPYSHSYNEYLPGERSDDDDEQESGEPGRPSSPQPSSSEVQSRSQAASKRKLSAEDESLPPSLQSTTPQEGTVSKRARRFLSKRQSALAADSFTPSTGQGVIVISDHSSGGEEEEEEEEEEGGEEYQPPSGPASRRSRSQSSTKHSTSSETQSASAPSSKVATVTPRKALSKGKTGRRKPVPAATVPASSDRWKNHDEEDTPPNPRRFVPTRDTGPVLDKKASWTILQLFQLFFSSATVKTIIKNTNSHAERQKRAGKKYKWTPLTVKDFYIFLAILLYTGLFSACTRQDYWRTDFPYNHPFPRNKMTRERFLAITWSLHLSDPLEDDDNERKKNTPNYDRLFKIKPLYTDIVTACQSSYHPHKHISIDERMVASKARSSIKQYHKDKPTKWGYKLFVLADSKNGYTWNFFVYTGKSRTVSEHGLSYTSVMDLMQLSVLGSGYILFVDNFYTSPALFRDLSNKKTGGCGTIRKTHSGFPKTTENDLPKNAASGEMRWIREGQLLFVKWMDKRVVTMCSSVHGAYSGKSVERKIKEQGQWKIAQVPCPDAVVDYNKMMGGVDLSDALIGYYSVLHKTMKWYKTFFFHFVDIAVVNAHIIYKDLVEFKGDGTKPLTQKQFREKLLLEMLEFAQDAEETPEETPNTCMPLYFGEDATALRRYCKRCFDAGEKRVKTPVYCRRCLVPLCLTSKKNCFAAWHDAL